MEDRKPITIAISIIVLCSVLIIAVLNSNLPNDYMDEYFHLSQTSMYYSNNYTYWNDKLTTFPGTFILGSLWLKLLHMLNIPNQSFIISLRILTVIASVITTYTLSLFSSERKKVLPFVLIMSLFPFLFFYNFLFYTDTYSNLALTLFFYFTINQKHILFKGLSAFLSVLMRQNNIIWINLLPLSDCIHLLDDIRLGKLSLWDCFSRAFEIGIDYIHIVIIDILFFIFLFKNNFSVVLGDKSHHELSLHLAQLNHFIFAFLFAFPFLFLKAFHPFNLTKYSKNKTRLIWLGIVFAIILGLMLLFNAFSYTHEYILSDNRHYSFYYFRRIYNVPLLRFAMIGFSSLTLSLVINDNIQLIYDRKIYAWVICTCLALVPSKLFEVRYFVPCALILLILLYSSRNRYDDLLSGVLNYYHVIYFIIINAMLLGVFIYYPFTNEFFDSKEMSRFMF